MQTVSQQVVAFKYHAVGTSPQSWLAALAECDLLLSCLHGEVLITKECGETHIHLGSVLPWLSLSRNSGGRVRRNQTVGGSVSIPLKNIKVGCNVVACQSNFMLPKQTLLCRM